MCKQCNWEDALEKIDSILENEETSSGSYNYFSGIRSWIESNKHVTLPQKKCIKNNI